VFSTVEFTPDALAAGREAGVALLRVVDVTAYSMRAAGPDRALPRVAAGLSGAGGRPQRCRPGAQPAARSGAAELILDQWQEPA